MASPRVALFVTSLATLLAAGCQSMGSGAEILAGSCEGSPYEKDMDTGGGEPETTFGASADGDDIVIAIDNLDANCCPSPGADIAISGTDIAVDFHDVTGDEACNCMCVMDFEIRIPDLGPGDYTIDLDYNGEDLDTLEVSVP
jgi:hypothetical protein